MDQSHSLQLISSKRFASLLGVSTRTLNTLQKNGDLPPSLRVGQVRRWRLTQVENWITEKQKNERL